MPTPTGTYSLILCCRHRSAQVKITRWINKHYIIGRIKIFLGWLQLHKHVSQNFQVLTVYLCTCNRSSLTYTVSADILTTTSGLKKLHTAMSHELNWARELTFTSGTEGRKVLVHKWHFWQNWLLARQWPENGSTCLKSYLWAKFLGPNGPMRLSRIGQVGDAFQ